MPKINDLNLKEWQQETIELYGDRYKIRKTFDIDDFLGLGIYGYEVYDEQENYLFYCPIQNKRDLRKYLKCKIYRDFL